MTDNLTPNLPYMTKAEINQAAYDLLVEMLQCCTINLLSDKTGISRPSFYRWLDPDVSIEEMDPKAAAWFIVFMEHQLQFVELRKKGPASHPRLSHRVINSQPNGKDNDHS